VEVDDQMSKQHKLPVLLSVAALVLALLAGCQKPVPPPQAPPMPTTEAQLPPTQPAPAASTEPKETKVETKGENSVVKMTTNKGDITIELFDKQAPITAGCFLLLVESGYYNGLTFHRVVPNFVIQGGDPTGTGAGGPGFTIPDEVSPELKHDRGMLSMAKTAAPNTGGSQFFIVTGGPSTVSHLNMKHAVFGKVLEGMDVVDKIQVGDKMEKVTVVSESVNAADAKAKAEKARVKSSG
jgi:peptidyl-prolyl cis-trans isomerase B (cyclophilin B)